MADVAPGTLVVSLAQDAPFSLQAAFACEPGQVLAIFGPSGSGKTTVLRTIAGLHRPTNASVRMGTTVWTDTDARAFRPVHERAVGFVFQEYALFPHLTAARNVTAAMTHRPREGRLLRAEQLLALVNLADHGHRRPDELSGGERQRVALARALARDPSVLLLDEPFAAIDRPMRRRLHDEIDAVRQRFDIPMVLVTHDWDDVVRLATHLLLLERGGVVASGPIETLASQPDLTWLRRAVGLGAVFDAAVTRAFPSRGLVELAFDGGTLLAGAPAPSIGARARIRIPAREIILAKKPPEGVSVHNILAGTVSAIHVSPDDDQAVVQLAVGNVRLLAEVTRDAVSALGLEPGTPLFALVKSVSIDVLAAAG